MVFIYPTDQVLTSSSQGSSVFSDIIELMSVLENLDIKLSFAIAATFITVVAYIPYFRDIFLRRTKPHLYTWLIWAITQGTAAAALLYGGGNFGAISLIIGVIIVIAIFLLSFKYGTKNITRSDTFVLILALLAIVIWWQLNNPLLAVLMVSAIDGLGYIPTFRKSFEEPWSETLTFWALMAPAMIFTLMSNAEYNLLTVTYLATLSVANTSLTVLLIVRRRVVQKQSSPILS